MTWFRVDDKFAFHPKAVRAGNEAVGVWVRLGAWSSDQMTDGEIPRDIALVIANGNQIVLDQLVAARLLVSVEVGYQMHDFLDWNPSAKQVKRQRKADAERKRGVRPASKKVPAGVRTESGSPDPDPDPDPRSQKEEDPPIVPRGGTGGADRVGGQEQLPLVPPVTSPPPPPPAVPRSQSAKPPRVPKPKAADAYAQAWVDGFKDAGFNVSRPAASAIASLGRAAAAHARYRDGEPITGEELVRWIRVKARRFREEVEDPARQRGGMTPFGFVQWLDDDPGERAKPWRRPEERAAEAAAAKLPPKPPEPRPIYTLEHQELAIKFQRRLQGKPDLTPEELTAAARIALQARGVEASTEAAHG